MKKNIGKADKIIRLLLGTAIVIAGAYFNSIWGLVGMIPILTAEAGVCPVYMIMKLSTAKKGPDKIRS